MMHEELKNEVRFRESVKSKNGKFYKKHLFSIPKLPNGEWGSLHYPFIYQGGANILLDSLKDKSINLILTDPPYGITQNRWDEKPRWEKNAEKYNRVLKDTGLIAICGTAPNLIDVFNAFKPYFEFRYDVVWVKGAGTAMWVSNYKPLRTHENIYVFSKKGAKVSDTTFNLKMIGVKDKKYTIKRTITTTNQGKWDGVKFESKSDGIRFPTSVPPIELGGVGGGNKEYAGIATQKPEKLMEFFIRGLSNINDTILDPYLGSGTTAKVAMENCRMCIGAEIDPKNYDILEERLLKVKNKFNHKKIIWRHENDFCKKPLQNAIGDWV